MTMGHGSQSWHWGLCLVMWLTPGALSAECQSARETNRADQKGVADLVNLLMDKDSHVRANAAQALASYGHQAKAAVPALVSALEDPDDVVRQNAIAALENCGPVAVPALIKALGSPRAGTRRLAALVLDRMGPQAAPALPALEKALLDKDPKVRGQVVDALSSIDDEAVIPVLIDLLTHEADDMVRERTIAAFLNFGPKAKAAVPVLINVMKTELLKESGRDLGRQAGFALAFIGAEATPALVQVLNDPKSSGVVRSTVLHYLEHMARIRGPEATKVAIPTLVAVLKEKDEALRWQAVAVLGSMGPTAKAALTEVARLVNEGSAFERVLASVALYRIDPTNKLTVPVLIVALEGKEDRVRRRAAWALGELGPNAADAVTPLIKALKDKDVEVRMHAASSLGAIGASARPAVVALLQATQDENPSVRRAAAQALERLQDKP